MGDFEIILRAAFYKSANDLLESLLQRVIDNMDAGFKAPAGFGFKGRKSINISGIFGEVNVSRNYYYNEKRCIGVHPADALLGLEAGCTPALAKLISLEGADECSYEKAQTHLQQTGGINISARQIQRIVNKIGPEAHAWQSRTGVAENQKTTPVLYVSADGTGVPMRKGELVNRPGKQDDGSAKTRQAYLGCVFTQQKLDDDGKPVRDYQSTTYVSGFQTVSEFGIVLRQEAIRRGMGNASETVFLVDGAVGLEHMGHDCFPKSTQIVDYFHAMEHVSTALIALLGSKAHPEYDQRYTQWAEELLDDKVESLIEITVSESVRTHTRDAVNKELGYFRNNIDRMKYGSFKKRGFFIGSGVIEAGCKSLIGQRCKQSGMFWSLDGAGYVLDFRCMLYSRNEKKFWDQRLRDKKATVAAFLSVAA